MSLNRVSLVGYLLKDPVIRISSKTQMETGTLIIRTTHRNMQDYRLNNFDDILIRCDDDPDMVNTIKKLKKYDLIYVTGTFVTIRRNEKSKCKHCGAVNIRKDITISYVYPTYIRKENGLQPAFDEENKIPEKILTIHYKEISNEIFACGTVLTDPVFVGKEYRPITRYPIKLDREKKILTQTDITTDFPLVFTFGQDAEEDMRHLKRNAYVQIKGFIHSQKVEPIVECSNCGEAYSYATQRISINAFSVNYIYGHMTDKDLLDEQLRKERLAMYRSLNT